MESQSRSKQSHLLKTFSNFKFNGKKISFYHQIKKRKKKILGSSLIQNNFIDDLKIEQKIHKKFSFEKCEKNSRNQICAPIRNLSLFDLNFKNNKTQYNLCVSQNKTIKENENNNESLLVN